MPGVENRGGFIGDLTRAAGAKLDRLHVCYELSFKAQIALICALPGLYQPSRRTYARPVES